MQEELRYLRRYKDLQRELERCEAHRIRLHREMEDLMREAHMEVPRFFGECPPPINRMEGAPGEMRCLNNGIYLSMEMPEPCLAVHETVAERYLTAVAAALGVFSGEYWYFDGISCAVPLFELGQEFNGVQEKIASADRLYAALHTYFPAYVEFYNDIYAVKGAIPPSAAAPEGFLQPD